MKSFSILLLLLVALRAVIAIPNPHAFGLLACGDDAGCLARIYGRALMAPSSSVDEMTTVIGAPTSSSDKLVTVTVDSYTTVPCSAESIDVGASTTTVSKHTTSTDLITVTITSSSSTSVSSSDSASSVAPISSTALISTIAYTSSIASSSSSNVSSSSSSSTSSIASTSNTVTNSGTASSSRTTSTLSIATSLSTPTTSSSTSSVGGVTSTSSPSTMAYISPSYAVGSTTGLQTYPGIAMFSSTSSIDALSATQPAITPTMNTSIVPIAPTSAFSLSLETLTTSSTSTHTTTIMISSLNAHTAIVATTDTKACDAFSTVYITITGTLPSSTPAASSLGTNTNIPANPLYSQSRPRNTVVSSSGAASDVGGYQASTDALSATASHPTGTAMTITSSILVMPTPAASNSSSNMHPSNSTASTSPFVNGSGNISSGTAPAARGKKQFNVALVMCAVGTLVMFAV